MALSALKWREQPAVDIDRAVHFSIARVDLTKSIASGDVIHVISAENPVLRQSHPSLVGVARLSEILESEGLNWSSATGSDIRHDAVVPLKAR